MEKLKLNKETLWNFIKYLIIGGTSFVIEITLFRLLRKRIHYIIANIIIYTLMYWLVFLANKFINFQSRGNFKRQLARYTILYFINLLITNLMLYALGDHFGIDPVIGKILVTGAACCWNFLLYKLVIYRE
ncbi:MAG: GtrA family protein [Oscillospiraceae bacterium]|nr:GtrA family protein [Oscillospiraceae bacterium]